MKKLALVFGALILVAACKKSETQYTDQKNKRQTVNDRKSDTIKTLYEVSDTLHSGSDNADRKSDNE